MKGDAKAWVPWEMNVTFLFLYAIMIDVACDKESGK
jgi:hypothetical protein